MRLVTSQHVIGCAFAIAGAVVIGGCGSTTDVDNRSPCSDAAPLAPQVSPLDPSVPVGNRVQLNVVLRCGANGPAITSAWEWSSSNSSIVSVDETGLATAVSRGTATVTATSVRYPGVAGNTSVRSIGVTAFLPTIQPPALMMAPGTTTQFRATVSEEPNASVVWSIDATDVATIDQTGVVRAPRCGVLGPAVVTARSAADPAVSVAAALTVMYSGTADLAIQFIRDSVTAQAIDVKHVRGTIEVRVALDERLVECGGLGRVELVVKPPSGNEIIVAAPTPVFPTTIADAYFNSAARLAGQPQTPNGSYSVAARAFDPAGNLIEETPAIAVTFDNP